MRDGDAEESTMMGRNLGYGVLGIYIYIYATRSFGEYTRAGPRLKTCQLVW